MNENPDCFNRDKLGEDDLKLNKINRIFKSKSFYFALLVFLGCLAPRQHRLADRDDDLYSGKFNTSALEEMEDPIEADNNEEEELSVPEQYRHCSFSRDGINGFQKNTVHLGSLTVCQSSDNENSLYIQLKQTVRDLCFVPVSIDDNNGGAIYIGEPRCRNFENSKTLYPITLYKNRAGFDSFSVDGVMIMKNELDYYESPYNRYLRSPDAYIECSERLAHENDSTYCDTFNNKRKFVNWPFTSS